jgi:hypothetical protein
VLSGRGLCDELITRPEESCRLWCVIACGLETSIMRRPWPRVGPQRHGGEKKMYIAVIICSNDRLDQCVVTMCVVLRAVSRVYTHRASLSCLFAFVFWRLYDVEYFFQTAVLSLTPCSLVDYFEVTV